MSKPWLSLSQSSTIKNEHNYALLIYGQVRCGFSGMYFETNLLELRKVVKNNNVDVYILIDQYNEINNDNELRIINLLRKYRYVLKSLTYIHSYPDMIHEEDRIQESYNAKVIEWSGAFRQEHNDGRNGFVAKLYYRRYYLHQLFKRIKVTDYDYVIWGRFFDMDYRILRDFDFIKKDDDCLHFASDNFFMGNEKNMDLLAEFAKDMSANLNREVWSDEAFNAYFRSVDVCLETVKPTFCSEVQVINYIWRKVRNFHSLRFDYNDWVPTMGKDYMWAFIKRT